MLQDKVRTAGFIITTSLVMLSGNSIVLAAEEHPDFTGVWTTYTEPGGGRAPRGSAADLPLTPEGKRRIEEYRALVEPFDDNAATYCTTYGIPTMMEAVGSYPIEFIQKPDQLTIIYEVEGETRRVYFGDRILPEERRFPNRQGYSAGHWEGDVLVVETTSITDGQDQRTHPHSDQARMTERFSLHTDEAGVEYMAWEMSMTDPVYYTEPVTASRKWAGLENGAILPYNCTEEPWMKLLDMRREQLHAGEPVTATMADVYATEMYESK